MLQRTLAKSISVTGVGLHSGERVALTLHPAPENSGISFRRTDLDGEMGETIKLTPYLINDTRLSSTIVTDKGVRIGTIEHIMSALSAYGIDNALIELNAPEIPIMDGSSLPFIYLLQDAGVVDQKAQKRFLRILKPVEIKETGKWVRFTPYDGFMHEVEMMRAHNLGLGGNLNNAIVIDDMDVLNPEGLRYPDEFVRHKILDAIGDLYIVGHPIIGAFEGYKSGHAINNALLRAVLADESAYEWVEFADDEDLPTAFHELPAAK